MTLISYKYKFIFLANMKCASTTIHKLLQDICEEKYIVSKKEKPLGRHDNAYKVKKYIESKGYNWEDFFVFTTIRNPYGRIVSCYKYEKLLKRVLPNFKQYVLRNLFLEEHFIDINNFIKDEESEELLVNKENIIKVENIDIELKKIIEKLELPISFDKLLKWNNTKEENTYTYDEHMMYHLKKQKISDFSYYY